MGFIRFHIKLSDVLRLWRKMMMMNIDEEFYYFWIYRSPTLEDILFSPTWFHSCTSLLPNDIALYLCRLWIEKNIFIYIEHMAGYAETFTTIYTRHMF